VRANFNLSTSFILFIIDNISVLIHSFPHIYMHVYFLLNSTNHMHFYEVLYVSVQEEISSSKLCG